MYLLTVSMHLLNLIKLKYNVLREQTRLDVGTEMRRGKRREQERGDREEGQGNPHRLFYRGKHSFFFYWVGKTRVRERGAQGGR